jgi:alpha-1,6-mannosyltransferase
VRSASEPQERAAARLAERPAVLAAALVVTVLAGLTIVIVAAAHPSGLAPPSKGAFSGWMVGPFTGLASGLTRHHATLNILFSLLVVAMGIGYAVAVRGARAAPLHWVVAAIVVLHVIFVLSPPMPLTDVFNYFDYARLGVLHGFNPYTAVPADVGSDPTYHYATWHHLSSPYGPLFTLFTYALVPLDVHPGYWVLKVLTMAASLGGLGLVWRLAQRRGRSPVAALVFVGLNPLLLVYGVGGVHTDFFIMLLVVGGVLLVLDRRPAAGGVAMAAAAGVKVTAALMLPFALIASHDRRRALLGMIVAGLVLAVATLVAFGATIPSLGPQTSLVSPLGALNLLGLALGQGGATHWLQVLSQVALLGVLVHLVYRTWRGDDWLDMSGWAIVALILSLSWVVPWYVVWLLPLAAVSASRRLRRAAAWITVVLMVTALPGTGELLINGVGAYPADTKLGHKHEQEINRYLR